MFLNQTKKAFTLVELLATLVILSIILVIAIPSINNLIDNSKKDIAISTAYTIIKSSKIYTMETGIYAAINVLDSNIKYKGKKPTSGTVQTNASENSRIAIVMDGWCITKSYTDDEVTATKSNTCLLP